jgi:dTDP-4-amino-4,6-dideoxygalactose transaminase
VRISVGDFKIGEEERHAILDVLDSGRISEGKNVRKFEQVFAKYIGTKYAVATSSGTAALMVGLSSLLNSKDSKVKTGTKVITTPISYIATSNAIVTTGLEPVYVDVDPDTFVITPETIKHHLEMAYDIERYSLILPVHLMGYPCDMDGINRIAEDYGLLTFEDSAQAHGTIYKGKKTGSLSKLSAFSFYIAHNIQAGEMGSVVTDDPEIARLARKIKAHGRMCDCPVCTRPEGKCPKTADTDSEDDFDPRFTHEIIGYNFKAMEFQAALGLSQMKKADWITKKRNENVRYLNENLGIFSDVIKLPPFMETVSYLAYPVVIKDTRRISRKKLRAELEKRGVETRPLFGCIPTQQPAYAHLKEEYNGKLPNAEYIGRNAFYIGCHQYLEEEDLEYIVRSFREVIKG